MTNRVTVDLDQLGIETLWSCVAKLEQQAEFLQFCCIQGKPEDPDTYKWPDRLREAAATLRKYGGLDHCGPLMEVAE